MPSAAELAAYYARDYRLDYKGTKEPSAKQLRRAARTARQRLALLCPVLKPGVLFSMSGICMVFVDTAQRAGFVASGIEPNEAYARWSVAHFGADIKACTWETAGVAPGSFDLVTLYHVLEHLRSPTEAMRWLHAIIKPDGLLYVAVPDMKNRRNASPFQRFHSAHLYGFARELLTMLGLKTGFAIERTVDKEPATLIFRRLCGAAAGMVRPSGPRGRDEPILLQEHDAALPHAADRLRAFRLAHRKADHRPLRLHAFAVVSAFLIARKSRQASRFCIGVRNR